MVGNGHIYLCASTVKVRVGLGLRRTLCATDLVRNGPRALVPTMAFSKFENLMVSKFWGVVNLKTCAPISQSQNFDYVKISWIPPIGSGHNSFSANLKPQNLKIMRSCQSLNDEIMSISKFLYVKNLRLWKFEITSKIENQNSKKKLSYFIIDSIWYGEIKNKCHSVVQVTQKVLYDWSSWYVNMHNHTNF